MTSLEKKLKELNDNVEIYERKSRKRAFIYSLLIPAVLLTVYLGFIIWQINQLNHEKEQVEREKEQVEQEKEQLEDDNIALARENIALARENDHITMRIKKAKGELEEVESGDLKAIKQELSKIKSASDSESIQASVSAIERRLTNVDSGIESAARNLERHQKTSCDSIIDNTTSLEWFIGPDRNMTWDESRDWVENLTACGGQWRLPQINELASLYNKAYTAGEGYFTGGQHFPAHIHPIFDDIGGGSWAWSSEILGSGNAFSYNFNQGGEAEVSRNNTTYAIRVFAVRSKQP